MAKASPYWNKKDPPALQLRHDLMRAKLSGFLERPGTVLRRYPPSNHSLPARYARAISTYRHGSLSTAIAQIDGLIAASRTIPISTSSRDRRCWKAGTARRAIAPLRRAVALSHHAPLIEIMLAQALIGTNKKKYAPEAVRLLQSALRTEPDSPAAYMQLAMAYGHKGDIAHADLASAQAAFARGDIKTARMLAERAKTRPEGRLARLGARRRYRLRQASAP